MTRPLPEQADREQHALASLAPLPVLVVGHEVKVGDAQGDDDMNPDGVLEAREDLVAEGISRCSCGSATTRSLSLGRPPRRAAAR